MAGQESVALSKTAAKADLSGPLAFLEMYLLPLGGGSLFAWFAIKNFDLPGETWQQISVAALLIAILFIGNAARKGTTKS